VNATSQRAKRSDKPSSDEAILKWMRETQQIENPQGFAEGAEAQIRENVQGVGLLVTAARDNPVGTGQAIASGIQESVGGIIRQGRQSPVVRRADGATDITKTIQAQSGKAGGKRLVEHTAADLGRGAVEMADIATGGLKSVFGAAIYKPMRKKLLKELAEKANSNAGMTAREFYEMKLAQADDVMSNYGYGRWADPAEREALREMRGKHEGWQSRDDMVPLVDKGRKDAMLASFWLDWLDKADPIERARLDRAIEQGFTLDAFHGTKGDIRSFDPGLLGAATDANSARMGFFFSTTPATASQYTDWGDISKVRKDWVDGVDKNIAGSVSELEKLTKNAIDPNSKESLWDEFSFRLSDPGNAESSVANEIESLMEFADYYLEQKIIEKNSIKRLKKQ